MKFFMGGFLTSWYDSISDQVSLAELHSEDEEIIIMSLGTIIFAA